MPESVARFRLYTDEGDFNVEAYRSLEGFLAMSQHRDIVERLVVRDTILIFYRDAKTQGQ